MQFKSQTNMGCDEYKLMPQMPGPSSIAIYKYPLLPQLGPMVFITIQYYLEKLVGSTFA